MVSILLLYMLFASTFTLAKAVLDYVAPIFFIGMRMSIAGSLLLGYLYCCKPQLLRVKRKDVGLFARIIIFHIFFAYILEFWALQYVTSFKTSLLYNVSPFITALLSYSFFAHRLTWMQLIGLIIGFIGFMPMLLTHIPVEEIAGHIGVFSFPEIALLLAITASCYGWIIFKELVSKQDYSPLLVNGTGMFFGGMLAFLVSIFTENTADLIRVSAKEIPIFLSPYITDPWYYSLLMGLFYAIALILIANIICYNLYGQLLKRHSATFLSFAGFTTPLFAALFGWLFLGEVISLSFVISVCVIFCGLYLFYRDELKQPRRSK